MAINDEQKAFYLKIVKLHHEKLTDAEIIQRLDCSWSDIQNALAWALKQKRRFSGADEILLSIDSKLGYINLLKQRLEQLKEGLKESTIKKEKNDVIKESIDSVKFYPNAEASLWKSIREYERDIDELKGLFRLVNEDGDAENQPAIINWNINVATSNDE